MCSFVRVLVTITSILVTFELARANPSQHEMLVERMAFWESKAALCKAGAFNFPTKSTTDPAQPCDDGDMTMFNGLFCFAGDERGCQGVVDAQDPDTGQGQWFRSPRIRLLGHNDCGNASFSPDMALGVQLYLVKTGDAERAMKWAKWLDSLSGWGLAWFCTEQWG
ncbi:hypothetical protein CN230_31330 [Sinorhizobium meliloti]|uniref:hypothetical protein n=1 Tax=Rhizobium meliloti TaxID=382 RepID=UPI000FD7F8A7|nr:hypothetical protein [Sinorhizobium meliloti]RVG01814.1 hypothetical protein CN230_31330 [Sinorhizobium meliloti]